jgi:sec-independent protein translocase protein TatC
MRRSLSPPRQIGHHDELSVVDHLDELRSRVIVSLLTLAVAFGLCFWQNHRLLQVMNAPLAHQTQQQVLAGEGPLGATYTVQRSARDVAIQVRAVVGVLTGPDGLAGRSAAGRAAGHELARVRASLDRDVGVLSAVPRGDRPVTLGIGEPFTTTVTVSLVFALILSLPVILLQLYGFFMPAFDERQRRRMLPVVLAIPGLFVAGVVFGYVIVLPAAVHFFQNFNSSQFNVLVQASQYYKFAATTLLAMGLFFQVPVVVLAITRAGLVTPTQLRRNRRYAIAVCAAIAALLPSDAATMLLETVPLYLLFELSLLVATVAERRERARAAMFEGAGA